MNKVHPRKKVFVKSYGCQMNVYDSDRIKNLLELEGFNETKKIDEADLVILNTCHIREKASEKVYSDIGRINKIKNKDNNIRKNFKLIVAGCVAQAEGEEIKKRSPSVDYIIGPQSYHRLPNILKLEKNIVNNDFLQNEKFQHLLFNSSNKVSEFVTIQEGCDKFCSFCVVPYTRGSEFSRTIEELLEEVNIYINNGVKEVILLGQNVNAYHGLNNQGKQVDLAYLINKISEKDSIKRIRYMTSHPNDMSDSLIKCHGTNKKLMPFLHLPIQSGSNIVLQKMNRKHSIEKYYEIVDKLKSQRSDIALSSDFIVGFPGETDEDFDKTMNLIEKIKFVIAYSFMYSPRPGTPAANLKQISMNIKKARLTALQSLIKKQQKFFNQSFINHKIEVLFDRHGKHKNQYTGRSIYNQSVFINSNINLIGSIQEVHVKRSTDFAIEGILSEQ
jgi:tRNA-2-methylthio-N6-dimethylallyladenosine synthase